MCALNVVKGMKLFMTDVLIDLVRFLIFFLDNVVYGLIPTIYKLNLAV